MRQLSHHSATLRGFWVLVLHMTTVGRYKCINITSSEESGYIVLTYVECNFFLFGKTTFTILGPVIELIVYCENEMTYLL